MEQRSPPFRPNPSRLEKDEAVARAQELLQGEFRRAYPAIESRLLSIQLDLPGGCAGAYRFRVFYQPLVGGAFYWVGNIEVLADGSASFLERMESVKDSIAGVVDRYAHMEVLSAVRARVIEEISRFFRFF